MLMKTLSQIEKDLLKPIFWDTDITNLDLGKNKRYTIERILVYGTTEHIKWLLKNYTDKDIIETVKVSKVIDRQTANYWSLYYNIKREEIICFRRQLKMSNSIF